MKGFIEFPKPLVAVVNGPALGVMMTTLALCDSVYASDSVSFILNVVIFYFYVKIS